MIKSLQLANFKSWRDTGNMQLAPLTALFGSNSSGKTSLLQWLLLLKQTADSPDRNQPLHLGDDRSLVELGSFQEVVFQHNTRQPLYWQLAWQHHKALQIAYPSQSASQGLPASDQLAHHARVSWKNQAPLDLGRMQVQAMSYSLGPDQFELSLSDQAEQVYDLHSYSEAYRFLKNPGSPPFLPPPIKCYGFPDQVRAFYQNAAFLSDFELAFEELFARLYYLGPLREYPQRQYAWSGSLPTDMGRRGERVVEALLAARAEGTYLNGRTPFAKQTLEAKVASWLKELRLIESFAVRPIKEGSKSFEVWVKRDQASPEVLITDVGFGVSQILPVIALCYYVPKGSIVLLEQPEIHLHPRVQAGLADVFIDAIRTRGIQIILESHSEHLLRRLQRRIAEEHFAPADAALYFCRMVHGESRLEHLQLDPYGHITNWPEDFFGDDFGEIAAISQATLKRKNKIV